VKSRCSRGGVLEH